jgi:transcriptional regulator with XRE-family HTH domain
VENKAGCIRNVAGPQIVAARKRLGWKQKDLLAKLQIAGLNYSRLMLTRIENQIRGVYDYELQVIAAVLGVRPDELLPPVNRTRANLHHLAQIKFDDSEG